HKQHNRCLCPDGREDRDLVEVLDQQIVPLSQQLAAVVPAHEQGECMAAADPVHVHPVDHGAGGRAGPARNEQADLVAPRGKSAEHVVQVDFRATCLRVQPILPVDDEQSQCRTPPPAPVRCCCRRSASSTPLTKRTLSSLPYFSARISASLIATRAGTSSRKRSSAAPMRRMFRSITESRSSRQFVRAPSSARSISGRCSSRRPTSSRRYGRFTGATLRVW